MGKGRECEFLGLVRGSYVSIGLWGLCGLFDLSLIKTLVSGLYIMVSQKVLSDYHGKFNTAATERQVKSVLHWRGADDTCPGL